MEAFPEFVNERCRNVQGGAMVGEGFSTMKEGSPERGVRVINSGAVLWRAVKPTLEMRADAVVDCSGVMGSLQKGYV